MDIMDYASLACALGLFVYMLYALLFPEKF